MAAGWECPRCSLVLAPHVAEHRCDPDAAVAMTGKPGPIIPPGTVAVMSSPAATYNVTVTGGPIDRAQLAEDLRRNLQRAQASNWPPRIVPGSAA